jgi:hypothetical protein
MASPQAADDLGLRGGCWRGLNRSWGLRLGFGDDGLGGPSEAPAQAAAVAELVPLLQNESPTLETIIGSEKKLIG